MKPTVPEVLPLVRRLYNEDDLCSRNSGIVGGHLHIVLDDGNVEDSNVQFCLQEAIKDHCATCIRLAELLLLMSKTQRAKLEKAVGPTYGGAHDR
jgi:hypothetical protein